uniref:Uncharacterized protein n=1 Tax=Providencia alcalifaciens TaxID=126385 RepID=A0A346CLR1_9GAMM|nr:hypothetical protein [Providencia alcalifaciens]
MNFKTLCILLFFIIPILSIFNSDATIFLIILVLILSLKDDIFLCCTTIAITSYYGLMQLNGLPFSRFLIEPIIYIFMLLRLFLYIPHLRIKITPLTNSALLFIFIATLSLILNGFYYNWTFIALSIKDFILPLLTFIYFIIILSIRKKYILDDIKKILQVMFLSISTVAVISIINYIIPISSNYNRFVIPDGLNNESLAAARSIGPINIIRMQSLFGLSTQGAASCLYAISLMAIVTGRKFLGFNKFINFYIIISCLLAGLLSGAFTFYFTILIYIMLYSYSFIKRINKLKYIIPILYFLIIISIIPLLFIEVRINNNTESINLLYYSYEGFISPAIEKFSDINILQLFIGVAPYPKSYWLNITDPIIQKETFRYIFDNWILGVFFQMGLIGGILFLYILTKIIFICAKSKGIYFILCSCLISMLGFAHGTFIIDKLFIIKAMCLISLIIVNENFNHNNMQK